ncbi:unnamed protein product, partial [Staurois parvus]
TGYILNIEPFIQLSIQSLRFIDLIHPKNRTIYPTVHPEPPVYRLALGNN